MLRIVRGVQPRGPFAHVPLLAIPEVLQAVLLIVRQELWVRALVEVSRLGPYDNLFCTEMENEDKKS
jgi:hypothetical protein